MKIKQLLVAALLLHCTFMYAQVGILEDASNPPSDFPHPSSALDVRSTDKGIIAPRITLTSASDVATIGSPIEGTIIYNTGGALVSGYYYWDGVEWRNWGTEKTIVNSSVDGISVVTLGYVPYGTGDTSPATINFEGIVATKVKCAKYTTGTYANNHSYCAYDLKDASNNPLGVNWVNSFRIAKSIGGYLVTATSTEEWQFVRTNLLEFTTPDTQNDHIAWLGFNKVTTPGNPWEFTWITGENSLGNWADRSTFQFNFLGGEPNNVGDGEGCVHVLYRGDTRGGTGTGNARLWNDIPCTSVEDVGDVTLRKTAYLMIEFQN